MSQALAQPQNCCTPCDETVNVAVPGPTGAAGAAGTNGTNGINAFTDTTADFTQPAVGANVTISVGTSAWAVVGQDIFVEGGGYYLVISKPTAASITVENLGYDANSAPTTIIASGSHVGPAGEKGATGATGSSGTTILTTKGDILSHDGAAAGRLGVGTDGKVLAADSAQALGVVWNTVQPNAATDNAAARYDGTAGKPVPLQDSKLVITDDGAVQASGSGGNARGARAVDLQVQRTVATEVASGQESGIVSGTRNTASGAQSGVLSGNQNTASGLKSAVVGGDNNVASGDYSSVDGGSSNEVSGDYGNIAAGLSNAITGNYCFVGAGQGNSVGGNNSAVIAGSGGVTDLYGQIAHASGNFSNGGDAQSSELVWRNNTTGNTPTELFLDGAAIRAVLRDSFSWVFRITVIGRQDNGDTAAWQFTGAIKMVAAVASLVSAVNASLLAADAGSIATGWGLVGNVAVTADAANDSLKITVTGVAATNIRWVAHARLVEVFWPA